MNLPVCRSCQSGVSRPIPCLISPERLAARIRELARQISADYADRPLVLLGVLKGAWVFLADLVRQLTIPVVCDFVMLSSYGEALISSGCPTLKLGPSLPLLQRDVLIVEDILDTGHTLQCLKEHLLDLEPASVRICALLDKPSRRVVPVEADYVGFVVGDVFVVGFGIDHAEQYRELPYVGYLDNASE